jgi:AAA domain-containing protein
MVLCLEMMLDIAFGSVLNTDRSVRYKIFLELISIETMAATPQRFKFGRNNHSSSAFDGGSNSSPHHAIQSVTTTLQGMVSKTISRKDVNATRKWAYLRNFFSSEEWQMEDGDSDAPRLKCNGIFFELETTDQTVICNSLIHFPVQEYDAVFGQAIMVSVSEQRDNKGKVTTPGGIYYQFKQQPLGLVGQSANALYHCFKVFSNGKISGSIATKIFNQLISRRTEVKESEHVNIAFEEMSKLSESCRTLPIVQLHGMLGDLSGKLCKTLLSRWYWYYLRRRIELLGVGRNDITSMTKIGYAMGHMYDMIMEDAFTILPMAVDVAKVLKGKLGQKYTPFDVEVAVVARKIYHKIMSVNWTCAPISMLSILLRESLTSDVCQRTLEALTGKYEMVKDLDSLYFEGRYQAEVMVAERLLQAYKAVEPYDIDNLVFVSRVGMLTEEQRLTITDMMRNPISIVSGGAGTGKTTIIEQICNNLENQGIPCGIVAFTGKAVARVKEHVKSQYKPMTIHSLCSGGWDDNPEMFTHLIIDEASMVTISHMAMIYREFDHDFGITFVGDVNQLEPIEWGYIYKELLKSQVFKVNLLTQNLRIKRDGERNTMFINTENLGSLIEADRQVNEGIDLFNIKLESMVIEDEISSDGDRMDDAMVDIPVSASISEIDRTKAIAMQNKEKFQFAICSKFTMISGGYTHVKNKFEELIDQGVEPKDIAILSPFNRFIPELNRLAQEISIIDRSDPIFAVGKVYYQGDVVLMTRNDYTVNIMNGTSGELVDHERELNRHRMGQIKIHNKFGYRGEVYTGYAQIQFTTGELVRYFLEADDYALYKWCLGVIPLLTIPPMGTDILANSTEEWKTMYKSLNRAYQYYIRYKYSPFTFTSSSLFSRHDVQAIFEPLTRIVNRYGYMGDITHGYAMTVHKSEGSQWLHTIPFIDYEANCSSFLNNTLLNTMLTRAEESVTCIGNPGGFRAAALQPIMKRYDRLSVRLRQLRYPSTCISDDSN